MAILRVDRLRVSAPTTRNEFHPWSGAAPGSQAAAAVASAPAEVSPPGPPERATDRLGWPTSRPDGPAETAFSLSSNSTNRVIALIVCLRTDDDLRRRFLRENHYNHYLTCVSSAAGVTAEAQGLPIWARSVYPTSVFIVIAGLLCHRESFHEPPEDREPCYSDDPCCSYSRSG
jgi:hypothetical protein